MEKSQPLAPWEWKHLPDRAFVNVLWRTGNSGLYYVAGRSPAGLCRLVTPEESRAGVTPDRFLDPAVVGECRRIAFDLHPWDREYPNGLLVFAVMLPGYGPEHEEQVIADTTRWLSRWSVRFGGAPLEVVIRAAPTVGRVEWVVNPVTTDEYTPKVMALVALKLRQLENRMGGT